MKTANTQKQQTSQETKLAKKMNLAPKIAEVKLALKVTLKEIISLHQSDLEVLESSNERCQSKAHQSQSQPQQNQRNNKDKQEKV